MRISIMVLSASAFPFALTACEFPDLSDALPEKDPVAETGGTIDLEGYAAEGEGLVAWDAGHDMYDSLSTSALSSSSGECVESDPGPAFYSVASADARTAGATGAAHAVGVSGFSNFMTTLGEGDLSLLTVRFGELNLGEDVEGADWWWSGDTETRIYGNPGDADRDGVCEDTVSCSTIELLFDGEVILVGTQAAVTVTFDHNAPESCSDDSMFAATDRIVDMALPADASAEAIELGASFLDDLGGEGACITVTSDSPIVRQVPSLDVQVGTIQTGDCS